jgi:hydroxymethylpyrimidine pyrophosphatase-like HAD family hydrolase
VTGRSQMLIALDVDGTLYDGAAVAPEAVAALGAAVAAGHRIVIVTGRRWESLQVVIPDVVAVAELAVCEEGAVMVEPRTGRIRLLADPPGSDVIAELDAAGVSPLDVGHVVVGAPATFIAEMTAVRDAFAAGRRIVHNKASIALAPPGCDKGTGLRAALDELHAHELAVLAIGDAENDLPMFAAATFPVAVANADEAVRSSGVPMTTASVGLGVVEALRRFLPSPPAEGSA